MIDRSGPVIAATDYIKAYADQIRPYIPGRYKVLGTDGFGRSDTRKKLRYFFEVDRYYVAVAALKALVDEGAISAKEVSKAIKLYNINPDTAPQNTLSPVDAVINPLTSSPGNGLDPAAVGQRYLLNESTGDASNAINPTAWQGTGGQPLIAHANDIIEYNGSRWEIVFNSRDTTDVQYVINLTTGIQFYWDGVKWVKSIDGLYTGGTWNLVL